VSRIFFWVVSIWIVVSADTWIMMWVGLELNVLVFIRIMFNYSNTLTGERIVRYFLVQVLGSLIFLFAVTAGGRLYQMFGTSLLVTLAIALKLGCAPLHQWFPGVVEGISWTRFSFLLTFQKIAPFVVLLQNCEVNLVFAIALMSAVVGGFGGFNQLFLRKLLAYSSITHIGWILMAIEMYLVFWFYYGLYMLILSFLISIFLAKNLYSVSLLFRDYNDRPILLTLLSLGGLPPLLGFLPKLMVLLEVSKVHYAVAIGLILGSLLNLGYYVRLVFKSLCLWIWISRKGEQKGKWFAAYSYMSIGITVPLVVFIV